ncbi:hypothetical protein BDF14DRAFT_1815356 [Spinellus fusiger]|nr:hypothetical protein BDF14DRAFT_1815356 [Spinellus fusiger]
MPRCCLCTHHTACQRWFHVNISLCNTIESKRSRVSQSEYSKEIARKHKKVASVFSLWTKHRYSEGVLQFYGRIQVPESKPILYFCYTLGLLFLILLLCLYIFVVI